MSKSLDQHRSSVTFPMSVLLEIINDIQSRLLADRHEVLEAIGSEVLKKVYAAYLVKARGGTGADGIKWDGIQQRSLSRRQGRASAGSKKIPVRTSREAAGRSQTIGPNAGGYEIGRNTGRQLSSLRPGASGPGGDSLTVGQASVTVKATLEYSSNFDERRPIMPETIPQVWLDDLVNLVLSHSEDAIEPAIHRA